VSAAEQLGKVRQRARRIKAGRFARGMARFGLGSRAMIYLPLAVLMIDLAVGGRVGETDQGGALRDIGAAPVGKVFLVVFAAGVLCYTSWRWAEAILGRHLEDINASERAKAFVEGLCYLPFGVMAVAVSVGDPADSEQAGKYRSISAQVMQATAGRVLVGAVGVVVVGVGCFLFSEGPRRSFADDLDLGGAPPFWRRLTLVTGVVGSVTRGAVFAMSGVLVVIAAVTARPSKAGGIDTALRTVARVPLGQTGLVLASVGIAAFGVFALCEARWRDVR
jgi:hypothetical protein